MSDTLVIIPAYNEEENLPAVIEKLEEGAPGLDYLIVNDGSSDGTAELCAARGFHVLNLPVNLGLAGAFRAGMRYADRRGYRFAVQFDGDGQHRAEYIAAMREKMEEGYDIVIASRFVSERKPGTLRMLGSRLICWAIRLASGARLGDPTSGMRMYGRRMIELFSGHINYPPEPDTLSWLIKNGAKVVEIQAKMDLRTAGASYLTPVNAVKYMTRTLLSILLIQSFRADDPRGKTARRGRGDGL